MSTNPQGKEQKEEKAFYTKVFDFFADHWKSVIFTSGIALILEHLGLMKVLIKFSWLVVSSLASQGPVSPVAFAPGMPAVILLDDAAFVSRYAEKSPLDRCVLADDLERILAKSARLVAVDFDLSPLVRMNESERQCQDRLDSLLDRESARLLLLTPFAAATPDMYRVKHEWMHARCQAGLHFADGTIEQSMGLVTEQVIGKDAAAGARFADQLHSGLSDHVCASIGPVDTAAAGNPWLVPQADRRVAHGDEAPINFPEAIRSLAVLTLDSPEFDALGSMAGSAVVFGGSWGKDDMFLTAIGNLPGAVLHGLRMVNLANPVRTLPPVVGLLFDFGIALCFAWVVHHFWDCYVGARRIDLALAAADNRKAYGLSTFVMLMFVALYAALVLLFFLAAQFLYSEARILIAPLLIALGILVDGFVTGPVDKIAALLEAAHDPSGAGHGQAHAADMAQVRSFLLWGGSLLGGLAVLYWGGWVDLRRLAGVGLFAGEVFLYIIIVPQCVYRLWCWAAGRLGQRRQAAAAAAPGEARAALPHGPAPVTPAFRGFARCLAFARLGVFLAVMAWAAGLLVH